MAFIALETYQSIKSYQFDLSIVMALSARSNRHSCHLIMDIVESLSVRSWHHQTILIKLTVSVDVIMINHITQSRSSNILKC